MRRFHRSDRVSGELLHEVSSIIRNDMKDPRLGSFVSLIKVALNNDLKRATIYVSVYGSEEDKKNTLEALKSGAGFVRSLIGKRMRIRFAPEINFVLDDSIEYSARINEKLKEVLTEPDDEPVDKTDKGYEE
ncbi:Ribosome-binding factor A [hydrothermal vent metagenome]|uniref:Ribosome-binding factor A n=1 Tax=hydrothermal vent metagenome TaxID=652676 RepID=A0A3B1CPK2_9ZZZZ